MFTEADVISRYTRREAIEDGVLVQLSGPDYQGDEWIPEMCQEAGFRYPVAMTTTAFAKCVVPIDGDGEQLAPCQDAKGRLWDVLWMLKLAIRQSQEPGSILRFSLRVVPNVPVDSDRHPKAKLTFLKCVCGPDDEGHCCLTIMLQEED